MTCIQFHDQLRSDHFKLAAGLIIFNQLHDRIMTDLGSPTSWFAAVPHPMLLSTCRVLLPGEDLQVARRNDFQMNEISRVLDLAEYLMTILTEQGCSFKNPTYPILQCT